MTVENTTQIDAKNWPAGQVGNVGITSYDPVTVGTPTTSVFEYETGPYGVDDGGTILFLLPIPNDRGVPQFSDPSSPDYVTVETTGAAHVSARWQTKAFVRPWVKGVAVDVTRGALSPGDIVRLTWGDTTHGSPGATTQSYAEADSTVRVVADIFATGVYYDVPGRTGIEVRPGPTERLVVIVRNVAAQQGRANVTVRAVDRYGNVNNAHEGPISVRELQQDRHITDSVFDSDHRGILSFDVNLAILDKPQRFIVTDDQGQQYCSNPIFADESDSLLLWGDTQGQTGETVGAGSLREFFIYARDAACLDFVTHSANDFQIENDAYEEVLELSDEYTVNGEFTAFAGYEWSGNTPTGGDHNILFADNSRAPLHRSSHALVLDIDDVHTGRRTISDVYSALDDPGIEYLTVAHVGGRLANLDLIDPVRTPVLEMTSVHGWFEWFAMDALEKGLEVGLIAASDDHSGRPGGSFPSLPVFGVRNGLAAVRAKQNSRRSIMAAMRRRDCYATTGERIFLEVIADGHRMGEVWDSPKAPTIHVTAHGTASVERIEILQPSKGVVSSWSAINTPSQRRVRLSWQGARDRNRGRVQDWSGSLRVVGAEILSARTWAFDHPDQGITAQNSTQVFWNSTTNGDHDGVELDLNRPAEAIEFDAGGIQLHIAADDYYTTPFVHPLKEGVDRAVRCELLTEAVLPLDAEVEFTDLPWSVGRNIYVVKVIQGDGHIAWSSPFFVDNTSSS